MAVLLREPAAGKTVFEELDVELGLEIKSRTPASLTAAPPQTSARPSRPLVAPSERIRSVLRRVIWGFLSNGDVMWMVLPNRRC